MYILIIYNMRIISQSEYPRNQFWGYSSSLVFGTALCEGEPPWQPIHGCIPPCFFINPPNKGWEHIVLKSTARDKKIKEEMPRGCRPCYCVHKDFHFVGDSLSQWNTQRQSPPQGKQHEWTRSSGRPCFVCFWPGLHHIVQGDLELKILLPQHPEY